MAKFAWSALVALAGLGALNVSFAQDKGDDAPRPETRQDASAASSNESPTNDAPIVYTLPSTSYTDRLILENAVDLVPGPMVRPELELAFEDNSVLGQLSRIRGLSLLTLSERRHSRLFLGVNEDGVVGLHFFRSLDVQNDKTIELYRLPHVDEADEER